MFKKKPNIHEHLWEHFKLHATQRVQLFRFYIGFLTLGLGGMGFLLLNCGDNKDGLCSFLGILLSVLFIFITWAFKHIDKRNRNLIGFSKEGLIEWEKESFREEAEYKYRIFRNDVEPKGRTHAECYRVMFYLGYAIGFIGVAFFLCIFFSSAMKGCLMFANLVYQPTMSSPATF